MVERILLSCKVVKRIATGMPFTNLEETEKYYEAMCVKINLDPEMEVHCSVCVRVYCTIVLPSDYIIHFVYRYTIH